VIGGAVLTNDEEYANSLKHLRSTTGGVPGPWDAWLTLRGLKTLAIRMRTHEENAIRVANFLGNCPEIEKVYFPGLPDFEGHELAKTQMHGFGGIVTVDVAGGERAARKLCERTELFNLAESLGGIESLVGYPWLMSHAAFTEEMKLKKGISKATVRLSIGLEHPDDLCNDLAQALDRSD
jgi:cystathionine beta-lyase/cystathionine gamma-synthase